MALLELNGGEVLDKLNVRHYVCNARFHNHECENEHYLFCVEAFMLIFRPRNVTKIVVVDRLYYEHLCLVYRLHLLEWVSVVFDLL